MNKKQGKQKMKNKIIPSNYQAERPSAATSEKGSS
jgi:hypothetical protein